MGKVLKGPLLLAAAVIMVRIGLEESGAPRILNNIFGVTWLYFLVPIYFAYVSTVAGSQYPYRMLFKFVFFFAVSTRLMVMVSYSLAYIFQWSAPRFSVEGGGVVGRGVTALQGLLFIPLQNLLFGVMQATIIGVLFGFAVLALHRRFRLLGSE